MSTALLFPGQGSHHYGMGEQRFDQFPELVAEADEILGQSFREICLDESHAEKLGQTQFSQPALYLVSCLETKSKLAEGCNPSFAAGHSVGEYAALHAAGSLSFADGLRIVAKRGEIMSKVSGGGMAAVIGMDPSKILEVIDDKGFAQVDMANFNSPQQTVISGPESDIESLEEPIKQAGAKLYVKLKVSGAFHSRMMKTPAEEFSKFLEGIKFEKPNIEVISNVEAKPYEDADGILELLVSQIHSPVKWSETIKYLRESGVSEFLECGPGKVLTKLLRQIP